MKAYQVQAMLEEDDRKFAELNRRAWKEFLRPKSVFNGFDQCIMTGFQGGNGVIDLPELSYDQEATTLENGLKAHYSNPRDKWHVLRKEEVSDNPEDFYSHHVNQFEIRYRIPALGWEAVMLLERHLCHQVERKWLLGSIFVTMMGHLTDFLKAGGNG